MEWWVQRGQEQDSAILVASRMDNTTGIELIDYTVLEDHRYTRKGKTKMAESRIVTCVVEFKQNVGLLGKRVPVCGAHGHSRTMKREWPQAYSRFMSTLADLIKTGGVKFLCGDFSMSLCQVCEELRSRGIIVDCVAWYP
jgi:hypothetical protein